MTEEILTADEVAAILKVKINTVRKWTRENKIPVIKIGGVCRYKLKDIADSCVWHSLNTDNLEKRIEDNGH